MKQIEIIKLTKEIVTINDDGSIDVGSEILNTTIKDSTTSLVLNCEIKQLCASEVKYGYIHIGKNSIFRPLFTPGASINVSLYGVTKNYHFHNSQCRIDGFVQLFSQIENLEARVFKVYYDASKNTLAFTEI